MSYELAILGAGNMAEAIARGVLSRGVFTADQIIAADPMEARRKLFTDQLRIRSVIDNAEASRDAKVLLLSTKPYQMKEALAPVGAVMSDQTLVISIAAGITSRAIVEALGAGKKWRVIRTMPNTPMLVGEGVVGMAPGEHATREDLATARRIFEAAAEVIDVTEDKIDAVTALSGSGPAYFYFLVETMIRAGIEMGLKPEDATKMAIKTAAGAGKLLTSSTDTPAELRRKVTTPGGTTHAAIAHMEAHNFGQIVVDALKAAEARQRIGEAGMIATVLCSTGFQPVPVLASIAQRHGLETRATANSPCIPFWLLAAGIWLLLTATGCSGTIHPPSHPADPVAAYLADFGRHSSLVLPTKDGGYVEWAFGDWKWFALGNTKPCNALLAIVWSPQSTLGRREIPTQSSDEALRQTLDTDRLLRFDVSTQRAKALGDELDRRYALHADTQVYSLYSHLNHVKDDEHYWGMHNCNHVTMHWMKELGCRVDGMGIMSKFKLAN